MEDSSQSLSDLFPRPWLNPAIGKQLLEVDDQLKRIGKGRPIYPRRNLIFSALRLPPESVRVVIIGQDPYPTPGMAVGRAFAVPEGTKRMPGSLKNIFTELENDLGQRAPNPSLTTWQDQGVLLLNCILTVEENAPLSHRNIGWEEITEDIVKRAVEFGAVGLLWGKNAALLEKLFKGRCLVGVHPSPLSAYRGFFGSKPFSKINDFLDSPIDWGN